MHALFQSMWSTPLANSNEINRAASSYVAALPRRVLWRCWDFCCAAMATAAAKLRVDYAAAVKYIFANADFTSAAKRYQNPQENWTRFEALLDALGRPTAGLKVVHIAGTNGKGTTSALCEAMLRSSGARVGLFTSPHLHSFRERIRVNGQLVSQAEVVEAMQQVSKAVDAVGYASPFEKLSALALVCFQKAKMEWAVLETGLGGRWDSTNHCEPVVCGITRVGMDHMNVLGNTIGQIASEKAGIMKPGVPAFTVSQEQEALDVLCRAAEDVGAPLTACTLEDLGVASELPAWLSPPHQQLNAAMAVAMVRSLSSRGLLQCDERVCIDAIASASWPARFERLSPAALKGGRLLLDVAHNEPSIESLVKSVVDQFPACPKAVIFGANRDKDAACMVAKLASLQPSLRLCVAVAADHPKAMPPDEIVRLAEAAATHNASAASAAWRTASSMSAALELAAEALHKTSAAQEEPLVLCCGSVFVAAGMRAHLATAEPALFLPSDWAFEESGEPPLLM